MTTVERLKHFRNAIVVDGNEATISGSWVSLSGELTIVGNARGADSAPGALRKPIAVATRRLWSLWTTISKLQWMLSMRDAGRLDPFAWSSFAEGDLIAYHMTLRAIFDDLIEPLDLIATKQGQIPRSYRKLKNAVDDGAKRHRIEGLLGTDVTHVVDLTPAWFGSLRGVRDLLVHSGVHNVVFPRESGIAFQVYRGLRPAITEPAVMVNQNVADFARYSAIQLADLVWFLDQVAEAISARLGLKLRPELTKTTHSGLVAVASSLEVTIESLAP